MTQPEFIAIGRIIGPWSTEGQLRVEVITDFPERFEAAATVYIDGQPVIINSVQWSKGQVIVKLSGIDSPAATARLRGKLIEIDRSQLQPLPEGQYYHFQIVGLEVWTTREKFVGTITQILTGQSNDVYIVKGDTGEFLIPVIEDVVKTIDLKAGRVIIEEIQGLLGATPAG